MTEPPRASQGLAPEAKRELLARLLREKAAREAIHPLSRGQAALWLLHQVAPDSAAYNVAFTATIRSAVDVTVLNRALARLTQRHEMLRTTYGEESGRPVQRINASADVTVEATEARTWTPDELQRRIAESYARPFDLERGPVVRVTLFHRALAEHVLLITNHHIAYDGSSIGILVAELLMLYAAERDGREPPLASLPARYADFVRWQENLLTGRAGPEMWAYWQRQLGGPLPTLELPTDRTRPSVQSFRGGTHAFRVEERLATRLRELARQQGATLYMVLFAAFAVLLHRYSGQEDILIGSPTAGRSLGEFEGLIGYFVNPVVLRADLSGNPTVTELLVRARTLVVEALKHADYPFPLLVQRLNPPRDPSRSTLFQVDFNFVKLGQLGVAGAPPSANAVSRVTLGGLDLEVFSIPQQEGQFDLAFDVVDTGGALVADLKFSDIFTAATIERMEGHLQVLLQAIVERPELPIAELPLLTEAEGARAAARRDPAASYFKGGTLHERFERQAARTPEAIAVSYESEQLTYAELNGRANQLAYRLIEMGVGTGDLVGLRIDRNLSLVVGILGILKAGGAYLPLDPAYPTDRVHFMLRDSRTRVVVTQTSLADDLEDAGIRRALLDEPLSGSAANPGCSVQPEDLAYVMYTSGSTGTPKGVQITHANVGRLFDATDHWYHFGPDDVWTLFHSYAFDFSVWELWGALLYGGRVVVVPYLVSRSPDVFRELLIRERVTVLNQTPGAFRQLIQSDIAQPKASLALRYVIFGGEALELQSLRPWFDRHGDRRPELVNMYGITETTVHVTYRPISAADVEAGIGSVIGVPIPDLQVYVLDQALRPVPIGVPGEMYVGGAGLARGYLERPELTAERFLPDRLSGERGARLYKTGDLARLLVDGGLEYLGRIDDQVKIRGHRIELGEIEAVLVQHRAVREAVVVARPDGSGAKRLVAYWVPAAGESAPILSELRSFLKEKLPEYMVPAAFVQLDGLPLTQNGKVDRRALPTPDQSRPDLDTGFVAPRTPMEKQLADIWADLLGLDRVGIYDNFFELGGHSLLATQLRSRLAAAFQQEVPLRALFEAPCVARLGEIVEALVWESRNGPDASGGTSDDREEIEI